jgi:hypothetical protein
MIRRRLVLGVACVGASVVVGVAAIRLARSGQPPHDQPPSAVRREASEYGNGVRSGGVASPGSVEPGHGVARPSVAPRRPPVPADLEAVFDGSADTIPRMKAVDALHRGLSVDALSALRWLLRKPDEDEALRNNVANKLRQCGEPNLVADLTAMAFDEEQTPKWRNYCVQHLYTCYEDAKKPDPAIVDTLFEAAACDEKLVRICAVWSLARAATHRDESKRPGAQTVARVRAAALAALRQKGADFLITTAGVQSCALLGLAEALPEIRALAASDETKPTHLRIVAVAALADLGDETDLALLDRLASSAAGQLKGAAALAAKKVGQRAASRGPTP